MNLPVNADNTWDQSRCRAAEGARMWRSRPDGMGGGGACSCWCELRVSAWTDGALPRTAAGTLIWRSRRSVFLQVSASLPQLRSAELFSLALPWCSLHGKSLQALAVFLHAVQDLNQRELFVTDWTEKVCCSETNWRQRLRDHPLGIRGQKTLEPDYLSAPTTFAWVNLRSFL